MQIHNAALYNRISDARPIVRRLGDANLYKLYANCVQIWAQLDGELVQCRRRGRVTQKYTDIAQRLDETLVVLEQQLTFGTLLKM